MEDSRVRKKHAGWEVGKAWGFCSKFLGDGLMRIGGFVFFFERYRGCGCLLRLAFLLMKLRGFFCKLWHLSKEGLLKMRFCLVKRGLFLCQKPCWYKAGRKTRGLALAGRPYLVDD